MLTSLTDWVSRADWLGWLTYDPRQPWLFTSPEFAGVFLVFLSIYLLLRRPRTAQIAYVLAFSLFFYYKSSGWYVALIVASTLIDFTAALGMAAARRTGVKKALLLASLTANLGLLAYFKYANWLRESLAQVWAWVTASEPVILADAWDIFLPVGISFYTFQTLSYSIDVYRGKLTPTKNLLDFAFFVSFFPQLVAGPIVRAADFLPQIRQPQPLSREDMGRALWLIAAGGFKKIVISDYIALNLVDRVFENPLLYSSFETLAAVYGYALQIYCDFSGYSDMAIGLGLLMGFRLPANFLSPYQSASIREFWRRWHISLSAWLKDYLYISMGGNRRGRWKTYRNLLLTMLLGGLWHGAHWKFVIWGGLHGLALAAEQALFPQKKTGYPPETQRNLAQDIIGALVYALGVIYTFHVVCLAWVFFRAPDLPAAWLMLTRIAGGIAWQDALAVVATYRPVFVLLTLGYLLHFIPDEWEGKWAKRFAAAPLLAQALAAGALFWLIMEFRSPEALPFIYFQF